MIRKKTKHKRKAIKKRRRIILLSGLCFVLAAGICATIYIVHIRAKQRAVEEQELVAKESTEEDEWVDLELTYLGSAKVSKRDGLGSMAPKETENGVEYAAPTSIHYVADYSDYQVYDKKHGFYDVDFDVESVFVKKEGVFYIMNYGKKPLWIRYRTKQTRWGTMPVRMGLDWDAEVNENTLYFYAFNYDWKKNGVLSNMYERDKLFGDDVQIASEITEKLADEYVEGSGMNIEGKWIDMGLTYLGSAKLKSIDDLPSRDGPPKHTDGDIEYTTDWFYYIDDYSDYQRRIYSDMFEFYDADFDLESTLVNKEGSQYVMVYGVKPLWLQYRTKKNYYGGTPSRMGVDWDAEVSEYTMYFYSIDYGGGLAEMEVEGID